MSAAAGPPPVNQPQAVRVTPNAQGQPEMVYIKSQAHAVEEVRERWLASAPEDSKPCSHFLVELQGGRLLVVFYSPELQAWYSQRIAQKAWQSRRTQGPARPGTNQRKV
jgi:hypothetical protein